jgi:hypothetical protein
MVITDLLDSQHLIELDNEKQIKKLERKFVRPKQQQQNTKLLAEAFNKIEDDLRSLKGRIQILKDVHLSGAVSCYNETYYGKKKATVHTFFTALFHTVHLY